MDKIHQLAAILSEAKDIVAFTGAGISTESEIPDFRSPGGIWEQYDPSELQYQNILKEPEVREKYWQLHFQLYRLLQEVEPNQGHLALVELEKRGRLRAIVTQNIDGLHRRAGNSEEKIIRLHGSCLKVECMDCNSSYSREQREEFSELEEGVPPCPNCQGRLKPGTVAFGQRLPRDEIQRAQEEMSRADLCLVLGSSLVVYPAAGLPGQALKNGAQLVIVNLDRTALDNQARLVIHRKIGEVMGAAISSMD